MALYYTLKSGAHVLQSHWKAKKGWAGEKEKLGNMSERVRTRSQSSERGNEQESSQPVESVIVQQPTEEKRQEEEAPTENQGIAPSGEIENEGAPAVQGPDVEAFQQELALLKIEDEPGDGPDVREGTLPTSDPTKVLEAGMLFN
ncbi:putative G antigen family E member 3 [Chlorocebus sabaeus]|uniref:putative G antigen family E member 3 n=2 Tax=Chlorocebus sabaeus TaxID=60711 RepID=UPI003BF97487